MKVCISCGKTIPDNVKFCGFCGTPQAPAQPQYQAPAQPQYQAPAQPQYQAPVQPQYQAPAQPQYQSPAQPQYQAPVQPQYQAPVQPQYQSPIQPAMPVQPIVQAQETSNVPGEKKKRNPLVWIIPTVLVMIAAVALILVFVVFKGDKGTKLPNGVDAKRIDHYFEGIRDKNFEVYVDAWAPILADEKRDQATYVYGDGYTYLTSLYAELEDLKWTLTNAGRGSEEDCSNMASQFREIYGVEYTITDCYRLYYDFTYLENGEKYSGTTALDMYRIDGVWYIVWAEAENQ